MISRASEGTCRQCGRRILWVRMRSGKNMPVDMALHNYKKDSTGKEKIVTPDGEVVTGRILVGERGDGAEQEKSRRYGGIWKGRVSRNC